MTAHHACRFTIVLKPAESWSARAPRTARILRGRPGSSRWRCRRLPAANHLLTPRRQAVLLRLTQGAVPLGSSASLRAHRHDRTPSSGSLLVRTDGFASAPSRRPVTPDALASATRTSTAKAREGLPPPPPSELPDGTRDSGRGRSPARYRSREGRLTTSSQPSRHGRKTKRLCHRRQRSWPRECTLHSHR